MNLSNTELRKSELVNCHDLKEWLGYKRKTDVMQQLNMMKIPYFLSKKGEPITTMKAINSALIKGDTIETKPEKLEFA